MANKHEIWELQSMQVAPLNVKMSMTKQRIRDWVDHYGIDGVYLSFSGGKDSTVLLTIAREMYPDIKAVFIDTGLEFPEIREFVKTWDNVDWIKPKMNFKQVIEKYGYPFISKEVSEAVWGARKYLTRLIESGMLDRPTDRPTEPESAHKWWYQKCRQVTGTDEYAKTCSGGWQHNTSEISVRMGETDSERQIFEAIIYAEQNGIGSGGAVRDFANLTGTRVNKSRTIDHRLWKGYRQCKTPTPDRNIQEERQSDSGDYP